MDAVELSSVSNGRAKYILGFNNCGNLHVGFRARHSEVFDSPVIVTSQRENKIRCVKCKCFT